MDSEHWWGDVVREPIKIGGTAAGERLVQKCRYCGIPRIIDRVEIGADGALAAIVPQEGQAEVECRKTYQAATSEAGATFFWPVER